MSDLTAAIKATGATIAFDATGGGSSPARFSAAWRLPRSAICRSITATVRTFSSRSISTAGWTAVPTVLTRNFGFSWSIGGWLLFPFLQKVGIEKMLELRARVAREIKTTFASHYTSEISLAQTLSLEALAVYGKQATGEKFLIRPQQ